MSAARQGGGRARPIEPRDLPRVVELYRSIAPGALLRPEAEVRRKLDECLLQCPFPDAGAARSVVHEGSDGRLVGFLGVIPRRWRFRDRTLVGVAATGMVVDSTHPEVMHSALWLTREGLGQSYDVSLCDKPTELVVKMRTGPGVSRGASNNVVFRSHVITGHGYCWRLPLARTDDARQRVRERLRWKRYWPALAPLDRVAERAATAWDRRHPRPMPAKSDAVVLDAMTPQALLETRLALAEAYTPILVDDAPLAKWQYDYLADYPSRGGFRWFVARAGGEPVGWILYYVRRGMPSEVASIVALPRHRAAVVAALLDCAMQDGCTGLAGTTSGVMAHELIEAGATIDAVDRLLVSARDPEVLEGFRSSQMLMTGLESEIWI